MKRSVLLLIIIISIFLLECGNQSKANLTQQQKANLRANSKEFVESLKSVLIKEIQTNGIVSAVSVCSDTAQILTNKFGITKGIYIKRVSFKNRNPNNSPDEIESKALKYFEELKSSGMLNDTTEFIEITEKENTRTIHFLKPIIVQAPCLNCHGQSNFILPDVKAIIDQKYSSDKATGYNLNDLRGAVSIQKVL